MNPSLQKLSNPKKKKRLKKKEQNLSDTKQSNICVMVESQKDGRGSQAEIPSEKLVVENPPIRLKNISVQKPRSSAHTKQDIKKHTLKHNSQSIENQT